MAMRMDIKNEGAVEVAPPSSHFTFSLAFADVLSALDRHIACERDLDDAGSSDAAYCTRLDAAEAAQDALCVALARITSLSTSRATDVPLRRMALIVATLVREGRASAFRRYVARRAEFAACLEVPGDGPIEARTRRMLAAADGRIAAMARLTLYRQDGVDLAVEPEMAPLAA